MLHTPVTGTQVGHQEWGDLLGKGREREDQETMADGNKPGRGGAR